MDKIELLRKGREKYEMLVVTRHVRGEEHFIGVFSSYEEMQKRVNPFILHGIIFVWQMNAGDQLGEGIFDNDIWQRPDVTILYLKTENVLNDKF